MPDAFVYYFLIRDRRTGRPVISKRRATLEAIKNKGEPLPESRMAVDDSEVDATGFLVSWSVGGSDPADELWGEIRSLRLRAGSRERQARQLNESTDRDWKLILCAEARELLERAERLLRLIRNLSPSALGQGFHGPASGNEPGKSEFFEPE